MLLLLLLSDVINQGSCHDGVKKAFLGSSDAIVPGKQRRGEVRFDKLKKKATTAANEVDLAQIVGSSRVRKHGELYPNNNEIKQKTSFQNFGG